MSLLEQARTQWENWPVPAAGPMRASADLGSQSLQVDLLAWDRLGCELNSLVLLDRDMAGSPAGGLRKAAAELTARLTYLLEPIRVIEADEHEGVQLRSDPPERGGDSTLYYELLVDREGRLRLGRYEKSPGAPRRAVPAQLTRQVLSRLINDFSQVAETVRGATRKTA